MRRFALIAVGVIGVGGCQQPMQISQPSLAKPQVVAAAQQGRPAKAGPHPYQYLAPQAPRHPWIPYAASRQWKWIVIHHSVTLRGSAASFDRYHRDVHHWDEL